MGQWDKDGTKLRDIFVPSTPLLFTSISGSMGQRDKDIDTFKKVRVKKVAFNSVPLSHKSLNHCRQ